MTFLFLCAQLCTAWALFTASLLLFGGAIVGAVILFWLEKLVKEVRKHVLVVIWRSVGAATLGLLWNDFGVLLLLESYYALVRAFRTTAWAAWLYSNVKLAIQLVVLYYYVYHLSFYFRNALSWAFTYQVWDERPTCSLPLSWRNLGIACFVVR